MKQILKHPNTPEFLTFTGILLFVSGGGVNLKLHRTGELNTSLYFILMGMGVVLAMLALLIHLNQERR